MDIFEASRTNQIKELTSALLNTEPDVTDGRGSTPLIIATYYNHMEAVELLLSAGADTESRDGIGNTALMGTCFKGHLEVTELLIGAGADVDAVNGNGATALTFAATFGHTALVKLLLDHQANPMIRDRAGKTPVDHARVQENEECYEILAAAANEYIQRSLC
jgi:uncharacterized protein